MPGTVPSSSVLEFYNDAKIFITGGTGFLGKALIEKILRVCHNVGHIYILIRVKKGKDPLTRMKEMFDDPLFDVLKKEKPDFEKKVTCIPGDVSCSRLNMSDNDFEFLSNEVTHVFHSAATVRFNEKLRTAIGINVLGTLEIVKFCYKCVHLKVFIHVSTAYSNCYTTEIKEDFYEPPISAEKAMALVESLSDDKLDSLAEELIKPWPNSYSYTKAIAENVVKEFGKTIPAAIFRPGIVMGTVKEPVQGWIDNIYGPTGIIVAAGIGLLRVLYADQNGKANVVPVDMVVNGMLCCGWEIGCNFNSNTILENSLSDSKDTGLRKTTEKVPKIYNFVIDEENAITWGEFLELNLKLGRRVPSVKTVWYYTITITKIKILYLVMLYLLHFIPGVLFDGACVLLGKKPQMLKGYKKIHTFLKIVGVFMLTEWKYRSENMKSLRSSLSVEDRELFDCDMSKLHWEPYISRIIKGIRLYIFHEKNDTLPAAKRKMYFFYFAHRLIQICFVGFWLWVLSKIIFTFNGFRVHIKDPILMQPEVIRNST